MFPNIYADFHDLDDENRIRLNKVGTRRDLQTLGIQLTEGLPLTFYMDDGDDNGNPDDIMVDGVAHYSATDNCWVGAVDWDSVYHASDVQGIADGNSRTGVNSVKNVQ